MNERTKVLGTLIHQFHTTDATYFRTTNAILVTPDAPERPEMVRFLGSGMQGGIFCDPGLAKNLLTVDSARLQTVLEDCEVNLDALRFNDHITRERQLYSSIREFFNVSTEPITAHYDDMAGIEPDQPLFGRATRHWETVRTPIEAEKQATYLKTGTKQLTRYVRAGATFVRFDRSGILHSKPVDIRSQEFCEVFAGLMILDEEVFGYDTAFTTRPRRNGRLEFYVDLSDEAFPPEEGAVATTNNGQRTWPPPGPSNSPNGIRKLPIRKLKVVGRLCHCKSIRGHATIS
ncbi:hypothetical protein FRC09_010534 [Ceratobasidium sp. 395]|nr:hypothetical protein FRC09_010534 [Ceratobasidium sp. 395]